MSHCNAKAQLRRTCMHTHYKKIKMSGVTKCCDLWSNACAYQYRIFLKPCDDSLVATLCLFWLLVNNPMILAVIYACMAQTARLDELPCVRCPWRCIVPNICNSATQHIFWTCAVDTFGTAIMHCGNMTAEQKQKLNKTFCHEFRGIFHFLHKVMYGEFLCEILFSF